MTSGPLEVELRVVMNHQVSAGNQTWVLERSAGALSH